MAACRMIRITATTMPEAAAGQLRLMAFLSPAFPVGGFSYSHGLERAAFDGLLPDADALREWLADLVAFDPEHKAGISNLLTIYSALTGRSIPQIVAEYDGKMYGHLKGDLAEIVVEALRPVRERTLEWMESPDRLDEVLAEGAAKASAIAQGTLSRIYDRVGLLPPKRG